MNDQGKHSCHEAASSFSIRYNDGMARIVVDARWLKQTGIGRYIENILIELVAIKHEHELVLLMREEDVDQLPKELRHLERQVTNIGWYTPQEQLMLPKLLSEMKPDLVHFANFNIPLQYYQPFVVTIHDLTLLRFKNIRGGLLAPFTYTLKDVVMRHVLKTAVKRSRIIFTPSKFVLDDVVKRYRVPKEKILVTYNAADIPMKHGRVNLKKLGITKPFIMHVGNAYPHKNLTRLINALPIINAERKQPVQLVIAGKKDEFHAQLEKLVVKQKLTQDVIFTDRVTDAELVGLYSAASLYALPSLSEGFGIPGLEAMSYGLPVVSSDATCMPEVFGDAAVYFDGRKDADIARAISEVLDDPRKQAELIKHGAACVKRYSWRKSAEAVLTGYDQALKQKQKSDPIRRLLGRS